MSYAPGSTFISEFITNGASGAAVNADALPTATLSHNGADDGSVVLTVSNVDTGRYRITGTIPNSYAASDAISILVVATVAGIVGKQIIFSGPLEPGWTPGQTYVTEFITSAANGAAVNADAPPTASMAHNGFDDGTVTVAVTNVDTGRYSVSAAIPSTYAAGDAISVLVDATVAGIALKQIAYAGALAAAVVTTIGGVSLSQVRTQIADRPQMYPPMSAAPEIIGYADGVLTQFSLTYENFIPGTLTVYSAPLPAAGALPVFTAVSPSQYTVGSPSGGVNGTNATNQVVTFNSAPAAGTIVMARYQVTAFSDSDLTFYLTAAAGLYADALSILKRVQFDIIPVILGDQRRMLILSEGAFKTDPSGYRAGLASVRAELAADLEGGPLPDTNVPQLLIGVSRSGRYTPYK